MFKSIYTIIISNIQKSLGSGWTFHSVIDYNPLAGSSYIKLPKELEHPRKGLINIQNIQDNKCFKWCLVRYLILANRNPGRINNTTFPPGKNNFVVIVYTLLVQKEYFNAILKNALKLMANKRLQRLKEMKILN